MASETVMFAVPIWAVIAGVAASLAAVVLLVWLFAGERRR